MLLHYYIGTPMKSNENSNVSAAFAQLQADATNLYEAFARINSSEEAQKFIMDLCTPAELQALADRWQIVLHLKQGLSYRQIHELTGISVTTIGRVARSLSYGAGGYELIFKRVGKKDYE